MEMANLQIALVS